MSLSDGFITIKYIIFESHFSNKHVFLWDVESKFLTIPLINLFSYETKVKL